MDPSRTYDRIPRTEDPEELLAHSDTVSSTVGDEKMWAGEDFRSRSSRQPKILSVLKEYWWLYTTALLILIAGLQLVIWRDLRTLGSGGTRQVGGDVKGQAPICLS